MSFWTGNALNEEKLKNYLVVLCFHKELSKLGKNLENAHFGKNKGHVLFQNRKFENKNFKRCFSLVLYIIWRLKRILYVFITLIIVLLKEKKKSLPFFYMLMLFIFYFFWAGTESLAFSVCTAAGQNSPFWGASQRENRLHFSYSPLAFCRWLPATTTLPPASGFSKASLGLSQTQLLP